MNHTKQTALQWYIKQCENIKYNPLEKNGYTIAKEKIIKQALEMEQEQIKNNYLKGCAKVFDTIYDSRNGNSIEFVDADKYYNDTYGGNNNIQR